LQVKRLASLPSTSSIERVLHEAEMTHPRQKPEESKVTYPHLRPTEPQQLLQVDIVPHFLKGGQAIACFNAVDVVSRYPSGQQSLRKRSQDAAAALTHIWQQQGIPRYTQMDNEACFSGGFTHKRVLGKCVRLALSVGTEPVFSPVRHPESNGYVERFHQDYDQHVWEDTQLEDLEDIRKHSLIFYHQYRHSHHHSALYGQSPAQVHGVTAQHALSADFQLPKGKLPLTEGRIHFIRHVSAQCAVSILNQDWDVSRAKAHQGVWATLDITCKGATLRIYDAAPDAQRRTCLAAHPFPLKEQVHLLRPEFQRNPVHQSALQHFGDVSRVLAARVRKHLPLYDVLMARLRVKVPRFSTMS